MNSDKSTPVASKSKLKITHTKEKFRPPTRTRVIAKRRIVDISKGGTRDIRLFFNKNNGVEKG